MFFDPKRMLIVTPDRNVDKKDYELVFKPESNRLATLYPSIVRRIDVSKPKPKRFEQVLKLLADEGEVRYRDATFGFDAVVFVCHGRTIDNQLGLTLKNIPKFVSTWAPYREALCVMFSCSNGGGAGKDGDSGLADALRDELCRFMYRAEPAPNIRVVAHSVKGHATRNPHVRVFDGLSATGGTGGAWIVKPGSALWPKWKARLWEKKHVPKPLRLRFPFMAVEDVHRELQSRRQS